MKDNDRLIQDRVTLRSLRFVAPLADGCTVQWTVYFYFPAVLTVRILVLVTVFEA